jgi:hypothetical protein
MNELTPDQHRILVGAIHDSATVVHKGRMMNERIRELADEAKMSTYLLAYGLEFNISIEKFAELIVRECIQKIRNYDLVPGHSAKWEDIYDIHARLLDDLGEELKEHFGVEECKRP